MDEHVQVPTWVVQEVGRLQLENLALRNIVAERDAQLAHLVKSVAPHMNGASHAPEEVVTADTDG